MPNKAVGKRTYRPSLQGSFPTIDILLIIPPMLHTYYIGGPTESDRAVQDTADPFSVITLAKHIRLRAPARGACEEKYERNP
jgi:hypothetical protein